MISKEEAVQKFQQFQMEIGWQVIAPSKVVAVEGVEFRVTPQIDIQPIPNWQPPQEQSEQVKQNGNPKLEVADKPKS
jgi:hypothetical protein